MRVVLGLMWVAFISGCSGDGEACAILCRRGVAVKIDPPLTAPAVAMSYRTTFTETATTSCPSERSWEVECRADRLFLSTMTNFKYPRYAQTDHAWVTLVLADGRTVSSTMTVAYSGAPDGCCGDSLDATWTSTAAP